MKVKATDESVRLIVALVTGRKDTFNINDITKHLAILNYSVPRNWLQGAVGRALESLDLSASVMSDGTYYIGGQKESVQIVPKADDLELVPMATWASLYKDRDLVVYHRAPSKHPYMVFDGGESKDRVRSLYAKKHGVEFRDVRVCMLKNFNII